jgi:hypothetical protein
MLRKGVINRILNQSSFRKSIASSPQHPLLHWNSQEERGKLRSGYDLI